MFVDSRSTGVTAEVREMEENFWGAVRFCRLSFDLKSPVVRLESTVAADLIQSIVPSLSTPVPFSVP